MSSMTFGSRRIRVFSVHDRSVRVSLTIVKCKIRNGARAERDYRALLAGRGNHSLPLTFADPVLVSVCILFGK